MPAEQKNIKAESQLNPMPNDDPAEDFGQVLAAWQFTEHVPHQRGRLWYIIFILSVLAMLAYSYFLKNPLFAIILIIGLIVYIITEKNGPVTAHIAVTEDGIIINNKFIDYDDLTSFYLVYFPPTFKNLYLQPKNSFRPLITVPLAATNPVELRHILLTYIKEDTDKEDMPLSEGLTHRLKL